MPHAVPECGIAGKNIFITVADQRGSIASDSYVIGEASTGALNQSTPVISEVSVPVFFHDSLTSLFRKMGASLVNSKQNANLIIEAKIMGFWVHEHAPGTTLEYAEVFANAQFAVLDPGTNTTLWRNLKKVHIKTDQNLMDATSKLGDLANKATSHLMTKLINDPGFCGALSSSPPRQRQQPTRQQGTPAHPRTKQYEVDELILD